MIGQRNTRSTRSRPSKTVTWPPQKAPWNTDHRRGGRDYDGKSHHPGPTQFNERANDGGSGLHGRRPWHKKGNGQHGGHNGGRGLRNRRLEGTGQEGRHDHTRKQHHSHPHHRNQPKLERKVESAPLPDREGSPEDRKWQKPIMWQNGDELDIEVETTTDIFSSDTDATEDEVLDDAPPEIPAKPNIVSGFNSGVRLLEGCLDKIRNRREPAAKDHTLQAWLQEGRGQGGQPTAYDQWLEGHYGLRVKDFALWEESQRRLLEELEAGLYSKYCEAEKARVQAERERARQEQQPWQVQHCQPFRQPQPQPQPAQPTSPTHADKLSTLLSRTANLKHALSDARDLVVQQDRRPSLGGAERSHQPPRTAEIEAFFAALATAIDSAAARLDAFLGQARKRKLAGGCFQWIPSAETDFCAAWEGVVEAYRAVWNLQQRVVVEQQEHAAAAAEKDDDVWEWYLAALAWFGKRVRVIGEGGWC